MSNAIQLFEDLSEQTWDRIRDGYDLSISQGEETITDFNLLELKRNNINNVRVLKVSKEKEAKKGIDWEWWIGTNKIGWLRYAVQAKKVGSNSIYNSLGHKVKSRLQIDILEHYSKKVNAIPIYCLYNYSSKVEESKHWHCSFPFEVKQLGCTITPSSIIRHSLNNWGSRTFDFIQSQSDTIPWRCLLKCPRVLQLYSNSSTKNINFENIRVYKNLPSYLNENNQAVPSEVFPLITKKELSEINKDDSRFLGNKAEIRIIPKAILVVDISNIIES